MFPNILPVIFFLLLIQTSYAQGLEFDSSAYSKLKVLDYKKENIKNDLNSSPIVSLKDLTPPVIHQESANICAPVALCYYALSMEYQLISNDSTTPFSYMFVYNQIKKHEICGGTSLEKVGVFLKNYGDCAIDDFECDNDNCLKQPNFNSYQSAALYRIKDLVRVFDENSQPSEKIKNIKKHLISKHPVVVALEDFYGFERDNEFYKFTTPTILDNDNHAITIIGYDDYKSAFEVINSYGNDWGNQGKAYIKYNELIQQCLGAYRIITYTSSPSEIKDTSQISNTLCEIELYHINNLDFQSTSIAAYKYRNYLYELDKIDWKLGDYFQLKLGKFSVGNTLYVFSLDAKGTSMHYPKEMIASMSNIDEASTPNDFEITLPSAENPFYKRSIGDDYIFILIANNEINDFKKRVDMVEKAAGSNLQRFKKGFGDLIASLDKVQYENERMSCSSSGIEEDKVVPIIIKMEAQ